MVLFDTNAAANGILDSTRNATTGVVDPAGTFTIASLNISALTDSTADLAILDGYIKGADRAITEMAAGATALGAAKARIEIQSPSSPASWTPSRAASASSSMPT